MKIVKSATAFSALIMAAALGAAGAAAAQSPAVGGPDAKGNAPVKAPHTINDGAAKPGANSFTEKQARQHIINAGYQSVSGLSKGKDGVWRGMAAKGDTLMNVALDFKGNVTEAGPAPGAHGGAGRSTHASAGARGSSASSGEGAAGATTLASNDAGGAGSRHARRHHRHCSTNPGPNGVACSGVDRNRNGISDKEDRATGK